MSSMVMLPTDYTTDLMSDEQILATVVGYASECESSFLCLPYFLINIHIFNYPDNLLKSQQVRIIEV